MPDGTEKKSFKKLVVKDLVGKELPAIKGGAADISKQFDFYRNYVNSPMYANRLAKMIATERNIPDASKADNSYYAEYLNGYKTTQPIKNVAQAIINRNNANLDRVADRTYVGDIDLGKNVVGGYDDASGKKDIRLSNLMMNDPKYSSQVKYAPVHEFSHAAGDGKSVYGGDFAKNYINRFLVPMNKSNDKSFSSYVRSPTEMKARIDAVRALAKDKGVYDAGTEVFSPQHLDKLKKIPGVKEDINFKQLMDELDNSRKDEGFIFLMNTIAKNSSNLDNNA